MLQLTDVAKSYPTPQGPLFVLDGIDLHLAPGESLALMGESGSGKSTLLHLAAGLDVPDSPISARLSPGASRRSMPSSANSGPWGVG